MANSEEGHLKADERVDQGERHVLRVCVFSDCSSIEVPFDRLAHSPRLIALKATSSETAILCQNEKNRIPLTQTNLAVISLGTTKVTRLTDRPERLQIGADAHPEHRQTAFRQ